MRAVVFDGVGRVRVDVVSDPVVEEPGDAVLRLTCAAICGSDLHFFHGKAPMSPGEGIGHEAVGVVEEVGDAVTRFAPGDRVVVAFDIVCGACWFCERGQTQLCEDFRNLGAGAFGGGLAGAQAERLRVPVADVNLLGIPHGVTDEAAVFVGDVLTTGWYAASIAGIGPQDTVAVVGVGPVGYCTVQAALTRGPRQVLALDRDPARLALAAAAGAVPIDVTARHPVTAVAEVTGGRGADIVIEAVGHPDAFDTAADVARRGATVVVVGMYTGETVSMQLGVWWARAIDLRFSGVCPVHAWWEGAMAELEAGRLDPMPLVSHRLPLAQAAHGYDLFDRREATKVLLVP
ncbi:MAG: alcohol dehydrogenase catalytic domain-containing protein [Actinomycetota bacterium]